MKTLFLGLSLCMAALAGEPELRGDGSLPGPGIVSYKIEREGAIEEDLRVQAMVLGHKANGAFDQLLTSETFEILPSGPSKTELKISEENFSKWNRKYDRITTGLRVIPRPGNTRQWRYENLLDPSKASSVEGRHQVHGRWVAQ